MAAAPTLSALNIVNSLTTPMYYKAGCASSTNKWYQTEKLGDAPNTIAANGGQSGGLSAKCGGTKPWMSVMLWGGKAQTGAGPDGYLAYDSSGAIQDSKMGPLFSYKISVLNQGRLFTITVVPAESPLRRYWWVLLIVAVVLVAVIVTAVMLSRRRQRRMRMK